MPIAAIAYSQIATYWGAPIQNGYGGWTFSAPTTVACRWEDMTERFMDSNGDERISKAMVWTFDRLDDGGYLAQGNHVATADPTTIVGIAHEIHRSDEIPDLRGLNFERKAYL